MREGGAQRRRGERRRDARSPRVPSRPRARHARRASPEASRHGTSTGLRPREARGVERAEDLAATRSEVVHEDADGRARRGQRRGERETAAVARVAHARALARHRRERHDVGAGRQHGSGRAAVVAACRRDVAQLDEREPLRERAAERVRLEPADDVDGPGRLQRLERLALAERDGTAAGALAGDLHAQVLAVGTHRLDGLEARRGHEDARRRVADAVRLEPGQLLRERERQLADAGDRVDVHAPLELGVAQHLGCVRLERLRERGDALGGDREARGRAMAAEALELVRAGGQPGVQVERRDRAPRARPALAVERDDDDGAAVALDEARGDDADHARVPALAGDDEGARLALLGRARLDRGDGGAHDLALDRLALAVPLLEPPRERIGLCAIAGEQQVERLARMAEPPCRVDARAETEAEVGRLQARAIDARDLHQRREARALAAGEPAQPGTHERAVLVAQLDDVGDRREGDEVEHAQELDRRLGRAEPARPERLSELEDHAGAAQLGERVQLLVGPARADERHVRQLGARAVVVADDDGDAARLRVGDRLVGREAAVDAQDQRRTLVGEQVDGLDGDAVALDEAARQVPADLGAELAQRLDGERRRADAVDVVVAVHHDAPAVGDRVLDRRAGIGHRPERERVVQRPLEVEEGPRLGRIAEPAPHEHLGGDARDAERVGEPLGVIVRAGREGQRHRRRVVAGADEGPSAHPATARATTTKEEQHDRHAQGVPGVPVTREPARAGRRVRDGCRVREGRDRARRGPDPADHRRHLRDAELQRQDLHDRQGRLHVGRVPDRGDRVRHHGRRRLLRDRQAVPDHPRPHARGRRPTSRRSSRARRSCC